MDYGYEGETKFFERQLEPDRNKNYDILYDNLKIRNKLDPIFGKGRKSPLWYSSGFWQYQQKNQKIPEVVRFGIEQDGFNKEIAFRNVRLLIGHTNDVFKILYRKYPKISDYLPM